MTEFYQLNYTNVGQIEKTEEHHHLDNYPSVPNCFFINGLGGAGKTFLYNTLLLIIRSKRGGITMIAVASSGIAALLLEGG
jgi:hypothetical protein